MKHWFLRTFIYRYHAEWIYDADDFSMPDNFEMKKWFKENISSNKRGKQLRGEYTYGQSGELYARILFCFRDKEDLMAFKLRWS